MSTLVDPSQQVSFEVNLIKVFNLNFGIFIVVYGLLHFKSI